MPKKANQVVPPDSQLTMAALKDAMSFLAHEMRVPIVAFRACVERLEMECKQNGYMFKYNHFKELEIYSHMMSHLLIEFDVIRSGPSRVHLNPERVFLFADVIVPAIRHLGLLLARRGLPKDRFVYSGMQEAPPVYVDAALMTQVFFNLLENAVKYCAGPSQFRVEISALQTNLAFEISISDHGIGVSPGAKDDLFQMGFRAQEASRQTTGDGLGLWVA